MPIDDRTTNRSYQLPNFANQLADDVARIRAALQSIDADIFARYTKTEVDALVNGLIQGAPGALDTLNELAAALGDDPNFAATMTAQLAQKANAIDVYTKAQADARYVQGSTQAEMVFIATANQSVFTLSTPVINKPSALVTVDGVVQPTSEYSLNQAGTELTLSEGVPVGTVVRVLALGVASAGAPADDSVTTPKLRNQAVTLEKLVEAVAQALVPAGAIGLYAANSAPAGWLKANGALLSRTTYSRLFSAIGTTYGAGNGSTTFALPDLRGEFPRCWDDARGIDSGRAFGSAQGQSTQDHKHKLPMGYDGGSWYGWLDGSGAPIYGSEGVLGALHARSNLTTVAGDIRIAHSEFMFSQSGETRPRNIALLACIKF